jgi:uncharacterized protein (DUF1015 family)
VRYAPRVALDQALAPPYDVISAAQREALARHPENVVHLELPLDDQGPGSRYQGAARLWSSWLAEGLVAPDAEPAIYPYAQRFEHEGRARERRGVFAVVELVAPGPAGNIYPHEFTLSGPREDRLRLLAATHVNLSPIFLLYEDAGGAVAAALADAWDHPIARARTPWGTEESLGRLTGDRAKAVATALSAVPLVFADGHHRYESALRYAEESGATSADDPRRHLLAVLVERSDPGLLVLPTHRVVKAEVMGPASDWQSLCERAFESVALGKGLEAVSDAESWLASAVPSSRPAFVLATGEGPEITGLALRDGGGELLFGSSSRVAPALRNLDVEVLHALLERGLGLTPEAVRDRGALAYTRDAKEAVAAVAAGERAAFLLRATPVERVVQLATAGHRLPQKSTYFEPKLTSGWLFHAHDLPSGTRAANQNMTEEKR